jgi:AcrR family transcriptional regulator
MSATLGAHRGYCRGMMERAQTSTGNGDALESKDGDRQQSAWVSFLASLAEEGREDLGRRKQDRSKRREQEILRASLRVFAREGISRARIGDIAAEAGMPVSSIYEYFPSKEELAYAIPVFHLARFYEEYREAVAALATSRERLRTFLHLTADFARRNPEWARTFYLEIWPSVMVGESSVRHSIDNYARVIIRLLRDGKRDGEWSCNDVYQAAAILNGSVNQVLTTWLLYRKPRDLMKAISAMIDQVMGLLLPALPVAPSAKSRARRAGSSSRAVR